MARLYICVLCSTWPRGLSVIGWDNTIYWCVGEFQHLLYRPDRKWITDGAIQCNWFNGHCCWWVQSLKCKLFVCVIYSSICNSDLTCAVHIGILSTCNAFMFPPYQFSVGNSQSVATLDGKLVQTSRGIKNQRMCDHQLKEHSHGRIADSRPQQMKQHHQNPGHHRHREQRIRHNSDGSESHEYVHLLGVCFFIVSLYLGSVFMWHLTVFLLKMVNWKSVKPTWKVFPGGWK